MRTLAIAVLAVFSVPFCAGQQFNRATASMTIDGNNGPVFPMAITVRTSTVSTILWTGASGVPFVFARSATNALAAGTGTYGGDTLDIPVNPAYQILADGYANPYFSLDALGTYTLAVNVPPVGTPPGGVPLGFHQAYQSLIFDFTAPAGYHLTAATRVDVTQGPIVTNINLGDESELPINFPAGMSIPYYGVDYTSVTVGSNGYMYMGTPNQAVEYFAHLYDIQTGPPRLFGFFSDLDTANGGTERYTIDTAVPGAPGLKSFKMEWIGVGDYAVPGFHHTFSIFMNNTGYAELAYAFNCAQSVYDTMVGITPGINCQTPRIDMLATVTNGGSFGGPLQAFWDWYGNPAANPYYPYPMHVFNLAGTTLHFQPNGSGTLLQQTLQYWLY